MGGLVVVTLSKNGTMLSPSFTFYAGDARIV